MRWLIYKVQWLHLTGKVDKSKAAHINFFQDSANKNSNQFIFDWIIQEIMSRRF